MRSNDLTEQDKIVEKLNELKLTNEDEYINELLSYFQILSPEICQKYFNINKTKTEKETFFEIIFNLINAFDKKPEDQTIINKYASKILRAPASEELKHLNIKEIPSRWDIIYSRVITFEKEKNLELIYYNLSNDLLNNIRIYKWPFEIIEALREYMSIIGNFKDDNKYSLLQKKFVLLGLCNSEYIDKNNEHKCFSKYLKKIVKNKFEGFDSKMVYNGLLEKIIVKYCKSKLAEDSFKKIFGDVPIEIKNEILSDKIKNYIYYLPFDAYENIGRTLRRFSLILINPGKNEMIIRPKNLQLNEILCEFINITVRKLLFEHEHHHLAGGLLYFIGVFERANTPKLKLKNNKLVEIDDTDDLETEEEKNSVFLSQEKGEIFEMMCNGKIFNSFTLLDLLFIANEDNDELLMENHCQNYKEFIKNKDLEDALKEFPTNQYLSNIVRQIYFYLLKDKESGGNELNELKYATIARKITKNTNGDDLQLLKANAIARNGDCPLSRGKHEYRNIKRNKV